MRVMYEDDADMEAAEGCDRNATPSGMKHTHTASAPSIDPQCDTNSPRCYSRGATRVWRVSAASEITPFDIPQSGQGERHNFQRAICRFDPIETTSSLDGSSIILPLKKGDVILVHIVEANGWALGTVLASGVKGWIPSNYCRRYTELATQELFESFARLWDFLTRYEEQRCRVEAAIMDHAHGVVGCVQRLLKKSGCLSKEALLNAEHASVSRARRSLLGHLSGLMHAARHLQVQRPNNVKVPTDAAPLSKSARGHAEYLRTVKETSQKAMKVAASAATFVSVWKRCVGETIKKVEEEGDVESAVDGEVHSTSSPCLTDAAIESCKAKGGSNTDSKDLMECSSTGQQNKTTNNDGLLVQSAVVRPERIEAGTRPGHRGVANLEPLGDNNALTSIGDMGDMQAKALPAIPAGTSNLPTRPCSALALLAAVPSPAVSSTPPAPCTWSTSIFLSHPRPPSPSPASSPNNHALASNALVRAHDSVITSLAALIGSRLHARCSMDIMKTSAQSHASCQDLLLLIDQLWEQDARRSVSLEIARDDMRSSLDELSRVTRAIFDSSNAPHHSTSPNLQKPDDALLDAATLCVRSANICFAETRSIIERIGDFDLGPLDLRISDIFARAGIAGGLDIGTTSAQDHFLDEKLTNQQSPLYGPLPPPPRVEDDITPRPSSCPPRTSTYFPSQPLYPMPDEYTSFEVEKSGHDDNGFFPIQPSVNHSPIINVEIPKTYSGDFCQSRTDIRFATKKSGRSGSGGESLTGSTSTKLSSFRHSEISIVSQASTRATSPEQSPTQESYKRPLHDSFGPFSGSKATLLNDDEDIEAQLLAETYAHELILTADGQVRGGSLRSLVERLTTYDSTPDALFLNTFYLTFRLFTTPLQFAQSLVNRYEYVGDNRIVAVPVRLRVYNVFKCWLETYWRASTDVEALETIRTFAKGPLKISLPTASKRLMELVAMASNVAHRPAIPRLVSTMGRTNTALGSTSASLGPLPLPVINKSQLNMLKGVRPSSGSSTALLELDPLEIARQITLIQSKIYCKIEPEELLAQEWRKGEDSKSVNVRAMSAVTTDLANLVTDTILEHDEPRKRAMMIKHWVKVAMSARDLCNYDTLKAILIALDTSTIHRLKKTWDVVSPRTMARLEELRPIIDCSRNWNALRQLMKNHPAPCLPSLSNYLTDLAFIDEANTVDRLWRDGSPSELSSLSVINFEKYLLTARSIGEIQRFQIPYRFAPVAEVQDWLEAQCRRVREVNGGGDGAVQNLYRRSLKLEPRDSQVKDKFEWRTALHFAGNLSKDRAVS